MQTFRLPFARSIIVLTSAITLSALFCGISLADQFKNSTRNCPVSGVSVAEDVPMPPQTSRAVTHKSALHGFTIEGGQAVQGGIVIAKTMPGNSVTVDNRPTRVNRDGVFVFGFDRDATRPAVIKIHRYGCATAKFQVRPEVREFVLQAITGIPKEYVEPPSEVMQRIRRDNAMVAAARKFDTAEGDFLAGFSWPARGQISGVYGSSRTYNGRESRPHYGVDVAAAAGTGVYAPASGTVRLADDLYFSGNTVIIDHGHGVSSALLHLESISVRTGQRVKRCDKIGNMGATGRVTGVHLDWRINLFRTRLDPVTSVNTPQPSVCKPN